jgi:plastocyanin
LGCSQEKEQAKAPGKVAEQAAARQQPSQQEETKVAGKAGVGVAKTGGTGTIIGVVKFAGTPPPPKKISVTKDTTQCGQEKLSEELVVGPEKGIKWAVVSLVGVKRGKPSKNAVLDQKGCWFIPHVVVVPAGETLDILNSDGVLHNLHTYSARNPSINKAQPGFKKKMEEKFSQPEIVKMTCDAHPWMAGWIVVADMPTAVTDERGSFTLADVPAGTNKLKVWHEVLGEKTLEATVKAREEVEVTFELAKK